MEKGWREPQRLESPEQLKERLRDPYYLPNLEEVKHAFSRNQWAQINGAEVEEFCTRDANRGEPIYEIINEEYIEAFSNYLAQRIDELGGTEQKPVIILEAGAGSGKLSHFLNKTLQRKAPGKFIFIPIDSGPKIKRNFTVVPMDYRNALDTFQPDIVITSWMPYQHDWTRDYRKTASVQEYILIGNPENTGSYATWGMGLIDVGEYQSDFVEDANPEYKKEGFEKIPLENVSQYQISRSYDWQGEHSQTIVFRR